MTRRRTTVAALAAAILLAACRDETPRPAPAPTTARVVSLSPAISRMLVDLDGGVELVGRTPYCMALDESVPVVGDLLDLDFEQLVRIDPTHVLVQPAGGAVDPELTSLAETRGWRLQSWRIDDIDDVRAVITALPDVLYPDDAERRDGVRGRADALLGRMDGALAPADAWSGRTLLVHAIDPVRVFGAGTYLADVLERLGAANAAVQTGWATLSLEDVVRLDPEAIVLVTYVDEPRGPELALGPLASLDVAAVRDGRLAVLAHRDALLPSSAVIPVAERLRVILRDFDEMAP